MYEFPTGLIRVLEKRLPDKVDIERMSLSKSAEEAFMVLNDTDYASKLSGRHPEHYKDVLADDFDELTALMKKILNESPLYDFLFIEFDFLNIKSLMKKILLSEDLSVLTFYGLVKSELLEFFIERQIKISRKEKEREKNKEDHLFPLEEKVNEIHIHPHVEKGIKRILPLLLTDELLTPPYINTLVDKELYVVKKDISKSVSSRFIKDLLQLQIDFQNTKTLLRSIAAKGINELNRDSLIEGGRLTPDQLIHLFKQDEPVLFSNLREIFVWYKIEHVIDQFKEEKQLWKLERQLDRHEFDFVHTRAKSSSYGASVVVGYFWYKMNAQRNVRLIMSGKLNGVATEEIKQRLII